MDPEKGESEQPEQGADKAENGANKGQEDTKNVEADKEQPEQGAAEADDKAGFTVNRHKYERDLAAKDKEIEDLRTQIAQGADTKEGREKLQKQVDNLKADMANKETTYKLELAGCKNAKAGKALLEDHGGDIAKLKEAEPWLFEGEKKTGSTGKKPVGAASDLDDKLDRAFGLK